ncbi:DegT/DnrJ/EryC1/StrS family aminotransferase [Saliphagus sp. GCM10025308]
MIPIANPTISDEAKERVQAVLDSGMLADGPEVREFEREFADYCGVEHAVGTANGTTALHAALEALDIGEGDLVLTTPFSFIATANAIRFTGAEPVFADIDPDTYNLDPDSVRKVAYERDIDAIVPVHLYGLPAEMRPICKLATELDIPVVEDAAQAHGAMYQGDRVGSVGDVACFSFYPTKNMTTGEGGMIVTDRDDIASSLRQFINHGRTGSYEHETVGHNFRMTSIAAAIGRIQLQQLPNFIETRRKNAKQLTNGLESTSLETPSEPSHMKHVYHQYTVRSNDRNDLKSYLSSQEIGSGVYYPTCIHNQPAYADLEATVPNAEAAADTVFSLPVHPALSTNDIKHIIDVITNYES